MADAGAPACEGERTGRVNGERRDRSGREREETRENGERRERKLEENGETRKNGKHMSVRKRGEGRGRGREHMQVTRERVEGVPLCVYCVHHTTSTVHIMIISL